MKHQWVAYVIVALLAIGAGVAIAGLPDNVPVDATITAPTTTDAPEPTLPPETTPETTEVPETTEPPETSTTTTEAPPETTEPEPVETTEPEPVLPERADLAVVAANGANIAGSAGRMVERLTGIGYTDTVPRDGTEVYEFTVVFYADGFEESAVRMAEDLELLPEFIAPLAEMPEVLDLPDAYDLVVYTGIDRAN